MVNLERLWVDDYYALYLNSRVWLCIWLWCDYDGYFVVIMATYVSMVMLVMKPYGITRCFGLNLGQWVGGKLEKLGGKFLVAGQMEGL